MWPAHSRPQISRRTTALLASTSDRSQSLSLKTPRDVACRLSQKCFLTGPTLTTSWPASTANNLIASCSLSHTFEAVLTAKAPRSSVSATSSDFVPVAISERTVPHLLGASRLLRLFGQGRRALVGPRFRLSVGPCSQGFALASAAVGLQLGSHCSKLLQKFLAPTEKRKRPHPTLAKPSRSTVSRKLTAPAKSALKSTSPSL
mmetsp:Transcript_112878/g.224662  ORF Transcript_112878/g.224662 Transcript_112878/m.224662 type:complete len:203 (+) Transcript_112878:544-1152(+)